MKLSDVLAAAMALSPEDRLRLVDAIAIIDDWRIDIVDKPQTMAEAIAAAKPEAVTEASQDLLRGVVGVWSQPKKKNRRIEMQTKLTEELIEKLKQARNTISYVFVWDETDEGYHHWKGVIDCLDRKIKHGTSDGKPWVEPDPPLTDQDACVWPRLLVMVRDDEKAQWEGPFRYVGRYDHDKPFPFIVYREDGLSCVWKQARRATPEEIEAAK